MRLGQEWARLRETFGQLMRRTAHIAGADAQREVARESPAIGLWAWRCLAQGKKARPALEAERAGLCGLRRLCRNAAETWNSASDSPSAPELRAVPLFDRRGCHRMTRAHSRSVVLCVSAMSLESSRVSPSSLSLAANERSSALEGPLPPADRPDPFSFLSELVYPDPSTRG